MEGVIIRYILSTFIHVTMYPPYNYNMLINKQRKGKKIHKRKASGFPCKLVLASAQDQADPPTNKSLCS
jgi:hypothetical protein